MLVKLPTPARRSRSGALTRQTFSSTWHAVSIAGATVWLTVRAISRHLPLRSHPLVGDPFSLLAAPLRPIRQPGHVAAASPRPRWAPRLSRQGLR